MHKILLSIGTNTDNSFNLDRAKSNLLHYFPFIQFTKEIKSDAYGAQYNNVFSNMLAFFESNLSKEELQTCFKSIEKKMGRKPTHKAQGKVIIDIDLIKVDDEIIKKEEFKRDYIIKLLKELEN